MFVIFLAVMLFTILLYAYIQLLHKVQDADRQLGEGQIAITKAMLQGEQMKTFELTAMQYAAHDALFSISSLGLCPAPHGFPQWDNCEITRAMIKQDFDASLNEKLSPYSNPYRENSPTHSRPTVETSIQDTAAGERIGAIPDKQNRLPIYCHVGGVRQEIKETPVEGAIRPEEGQCGYYQFSSAIAFDIPYSFDGFLQVQKAVLGEGGIVESIHACRAENNEEEGCIERAFEQRSDFTFTRQCLSPPEEAFWNLLEELDRCASSPCAQSQRGCDNVEALLPDINKQLHWQYSIRLDALAHTAQLIYEPSKQAVLTAPFNDKALCADGERSIAQLTVRPGAHPEDELLMQANDDRIVPVREVFWQQPFLCFNQQQQDIPSCPLADKMLEACAISKTKFWHFNPVLQKTVEEPVVYRFAVEI